MANVNGKKVITFQEILRSGVGDNILSIIFDAKVFNEYD